MQVHSGELLYVEQIVKEALRLGALSLMKQTNVPRNLGKTPELVLAESIIAAHRMHQSMEDGEPA